MMGGRSWCLLRAGGGGECRRQQEEEAAGGEHSRTAAAQPAGLCILHSSRRVVSGVRAPISLLGAHICVCGWVLLGFHRVVYPGEPPTEKFWREQNFGLTAGCIGAFPAGGAACAS